MNKKILALAVGSALSAGAQSDINDILITEYVEGTYTQDRAIELTNMGSEAVTFTDNEGLVYFYNPTSSTEAWKAIKLADGSNILAGVTIEANETIVVVAKPHADYGSSVRDSAEENGARVIESTGSLGFTGNDAIAIADITELNPPTQVLDIIGLTDSNFSWGSNITYVRSKQVNGDNPTQKSAYLKNDWIAHPKGYYDDLGINSLPDAHIPFECLDSEARTTVQAIQGEGKSSLVRNQQVVVEATVSAVTAFPVKGIFLYQEDVDNNHLTSDGIFVITNEDTSSLSAGDQICLQGVVIEDFGLTKIESTKEIINKGSVAPPTAVDIVMIPEDQGSFSATLERYEGMLVNLPADIDPDTEGDQDMRISKTFSFDFNSYRNNMVFSYKRPNMVPTQNNVAGSDAALAYADQNNDYRLIIESNVKAKDGELPYYPTFNENAAKNYIRINDSVVGLEGVISYSFGDFSLVVTNEVDKDNFKHNSDRSDSPELSTETEVGEFAITIGTQNLLNLFNSPFGGDYNTHGENRGADSDEEYQQQKAKLVEAILGLDADIVGLMEIENNGFGSGSAIKEFVDAINENYDDEDPKDITKDNSTINRYVFIGYDANRDLILDELDSIGSDAISTGLIYRPAKVSIESMKVIPMPQQHAPAIVNDSNIVVKNKNGSALESGDNYQRDALTATFVVNKTGKRLTVAVNHLKSKGSTCWEEWQDVEFGEEVTWTKDAPNEDFQGSCENFRVAAAVQLGEGLEKIGGDSIIVGDLNAYALEDPLLVLTKNATGKTITTARDTFIGKKPQFNVSGEPVNITKTYGYINAVSKKDEEKGHLSWSYSYNDEIGSLDHILISPSLESRLIDAMDWHINAAESPLYDYNTDYKGDHAAAFFEEDAFRSSDHDPAIISLSYKYGEVSNGKPVRLVIRSSIIKVPYVIPGAEDTKAGDVAQITLTSSEDMSKVVLPSIALTEDGQSFINIDVFGIKAGLYNATLTLVRDGQVMPEFTETMKIEAAKQDSTTPKIPAPAEYDGSGGGSLGVFGLFSMLGLIFLRRRKTK